MPTLQPIEWMGVIALVLLFIVGSFVENAAKSLSKIETMLRLALTAKEPELRSFLEQAEGAPPIQARFHIPRALFPEKPPVEPEYR